MQTFTPIACVLAGGLLHMHSTATPGTKTYTRVAENKANPKTLPVTLAPSSTAPVPSADRFQMFVPLGPVLTTGRTAACWHHPPRTPKAVHVHQAGACL